MRKKKRITLFLVAVVASMAFAALAQAAKETEPEAEAEAAAAEAAPGPVSEATQVPAPEATPEPATGPVPEPNPEAMPAAGLATEAPAVAPVPKETLVEVTGRVFIRRIVRKKMEDEEIEEAPKPVRIVYLHVQQAKGSDGAVLPDVKGALTIVGPKANDVAKLNMQDVVVQGALKADRKTLEATSVKQRQKTAAPAAVEPASPEATAAPSLREEEERKVEVSGGAVSLSPGDASAPAAVPTEEGERRE